MMKRRQKGTGCIVKMRDTYYGRLATGGKVKLVRLSKNPLPVWASSVAQCKESTCNEADSGLIPGWERSPGGGNGNPLQYSCLGNPMDRGAWWATVPGVARVGNDLATKPLPPRLVY